MRIYNLGSLNIDYVYTVAHFVAPSETLASNSMNIFPGGKGLNQSVALARAGAQVIHGGMVGEGGEFLLETLSAAGVDTSRIEKGTGSSGHAIIQVNREGQNCILLFAGTNHQINQPYVESFLADAQADDILLLQNEVNALDIIFQIAGEKHMQIALNPSPFHPDLLKLPLSQVKWWFCNEIEAAALFGCTAPDEIATEFVKRYPDSNLILTLGEKGSMFINADQIVCQPIYPVQTVDTTAAGDTFTGYFLATVAEGKNVAFALDMASKASSVTVSRKGASSSIPMRREVDG